MRKLTSKQERFVGEYISNGGNATAAALAVYDCNPESARAVGSENLTKPNIQRAIQKHSGNILQEAYQAVQDALRATTKSGQPHHNVRLRAADMVFKLANAYPDKNTDEKARINPEFEEFEEWLRQQPLTVIKFMEKEDRLPDDDEYEQLVAQAEEGPYRRS